MTNEKFYSLQVLKISEIVKDYFGYDFVDVQKNTNKREVSLTRHVTWHIAKNLFGFKISLSKLGEILGKRKHCTVIHGLSQIDNFLLYDKVFRVQYGEILKIAEKSVLLNNIYKDSDSYKNQIERLFIFSEKINDAELKKELISIIESFEIK